MVVKLVPRVFVWELHGVQSCGYGIHMNTKTTAELIEQARKNAERSQKWTAEKAGMSATTFKRKINGGADFTISEALRVANALSVPPYTLLPQAFTRDLIAEAV